MFCTLMCMTVVHNDMHTREQLLKLYVGLSLDFVLYACLGLALFFC